MGIYYRKYLAVLAVLIFSLIAGCASPATKRVEVSDIASEIEAEKQREIAFEALTRDKFRLVDVSYQIFVKSVPLCEEDITYSLGTLVANTYMVKDEMRNAAHKLYGISNVLQVLHVMKHSAAERAGLLQGDIPLAVNGWAVPVGKHAGRDFLSRLEEESREGRELSLKIMREGNELTYDIVPDAVCAYRIALSSQDIVNAFADGENVVITRGMMRFTESDNELALVVSHELAHNVMKHIRAKTQNLMLGTVLDVVAAVFGVNTRGTFGNLTAQAYSQDFEAEADYVGLYMMALTGLDIENAPHFWRRMAAIHPGSIESDFMSSHPATPERFVALEKIVDEINGKIASGQPLEPELKEGE
jgi:hypothetical protein